MEKKSYVTKNKSMYEIKVLLKNIALMESVSGQSLLVNTNTHEMISRDNFYHVRYDSENKFYFLERRVKNNDRIGNQEYKTYMDIYDALEEKFLAKGYEVISNSCSYGVYRDPKTGKCHLFDIQTIRNDHSIFTEEFDSIETILDTYYGRFTVVERNGKKGIYMQGKDITIPLEYDSIYKLPSSDVILFEKDGKSYFSFHDYNDGMIDSPWFDHIEVNKGNNHSYPSTASILYCKLDSFIAIYDMDKLSKEILCKIPVFDEVTCLVRAESRRNFFLVKKDNLYGLYGFDPVSRKSDDLLVLPGIKLVDPIYDKIEKHDRNYYLYKDGKVGLYSYRYPHQYSDVIKECYIDAKYDQIKELYDMFLLFHQDKCDIITLDKINTPFVTDCEFVENHNDEIIFKKNEKYGVIDANQSILAGYDKITYHGSYQKSFIYICEKDGKQGIIYRGKELLPTCYKSVFPYRIGFEYSDCDTRYYFKMKDKKYTLAKYYRKDWYYDDELFVQDQEYEDINFYQDIMCFNDGVNLSIYDYEEQLLMTLPAKSSVQCIQLERGEKDQFVYLVDGEYYFYKDGKFQKAFIEEYDVYVTSYETDTDFYEVSSYNKKEYDKFCSMIDKKSSDDAIEYLSEASEYSYTIKYGYPSLRLKKVKKQIEKSD